jgi:hypothetical protein
MTLKEILLDKINSTENWLSKGELYKVGEDEGFSPEYVGRELRLLAGSGIIQVSYYKSKRNIDLARYSRIGTPAPTKPKEVEKIYNSFGELIGVRKLLDLTHLKG